MKKAALAVLLLGAALCIPGCGFEEGGSKRYSYTGNPDPYSNTNP